MISKLGRRPVVKCRGPDQRKRSKVYRGGFWEQHNYIGYLNCPGECVSQRRRDPTKRVEQFGADSPSIRDWVKPQDQVFANCNGPATLPKIHEYWLSPEQQAAKEAAAVAGATIPAPAPPDAPALLQTDRVYQIAAANLYAGKLAVALKGFREIAADAASSMARAGVVSRR